MACGVRNLYCFHKKEEVLSVTIDEREQDERHGLDGGVKQIQSPPPRESRSRRRGASPVTAKPSGTLL
jgi:hypothetical protein